MNLGEIGINKRKCVDSAQDRDYWRALMNLALNLRVPYGMELGQNSKFVCFLILSTIHTTVPHHLCGAAAPGSSPDRVGIFYFSCD